MGEIRITDIAMSDCSHAGLRDYVIEEKKVPERGETIITAHKRP